MPTDNRGDGRFRDVARANKFIGQFRRAVDRHRCPAIADADRDRQFAEAVRLAFDHNARLYQRGSKLWQLFATSDIEDAHKRIYGTPCTKDGK